MGISDGKVASGGSHLGLVHTPSVIYEKYPLWYIQIYMYADKRGSAQAVDQCSAFVSQIPGGISLILPGLLELLDVIFIRGALRALLSIVGRPGLVVSAPVTLADDPGQDVHLIVELS